MQKGIHQHFVGCVQHQRTAATRLYRIISQCKTAEGIHVRLRKSQTTARAEKIQRRIRIRKPLWITQCQTDRNPHIRHAHLTDHRIVRKLHRRVQNALRVHQHLDLICRHIEQPPRLDDLQTFVHHGRRIDRDLRAHVPVRMAQRLRQRHMRKLLPRKSAKRTAARCQEYFFNRTVPIALQALKNCAVLAVHRQQLHAAFGCRLHDQLPARQQRLLVGECNILACQNRVIGRFQPAHSHQRVHHHVTVRGRRRDQALPAMQERDLRKLRRQRERVLSPLGNRELRTKRRDLLRQKRGIPAAGQRCHTKSIGIGSNDL